MLKEIKEKIIEILRKVWNEGGGEFSPIEEEHLEDYTDEILELFAQEILNCPENKKENWTKFPPDKRSRWWDRLVDILEDQFPKHKCKERGRALVLLAYAEMMFQEAEREISQTEKAFGGCRDCYSKGYFTEMRGTKTSPDFEGDKEYVSEPKIEMNFCKCERGQALKNLLASQKIAEENPTGKARASAKIAEEWEKEFDEKFCVKNQDSFFDIVEERGDKYIKARKPRPSEIKSFICTLLSQTRKETLEEIMEWAKGQKNRVDNCIMNPEREVENRILNQLTRLLTNLKSKK